MGSKSQKACKNCVTMPYLHTWTVQDHSLQLKNTWCHSIPLQRESQLKSHCHQVIPGQEIQSPSPSRKSMTESNRNFSVKTEERYTHRPQVKYITLPMLAWPGVILPLSYSLHRRQPTRNIAWTLPNMRTNFCWLIWKAANGAPNCFLSLRYLTYNKSS